MPPPQLGPQKDSIDTIWFPASLPTDKPVLTEVLYHEGGKANRLKNKTMLVLFTQFLEVLVSMALFVRRPSAFVLTINPIFLGVIVLALNKLPKLELWCLRVHSRFTLGGSLVIIAVATWEALNGEGITRFLLHIPLVVDIFAGFWTNFVYYEIIREGERLEAEYGSENAALDAFRARAGTPGTTYIATPAAVPVIEPVIPPTPRAPAKPDGIMTPAPPPAYTPEVSVVGGSYLQALWSTITKPDDHGLAARSTGLSILSDELGEPMYGRSMLVVRWLCRTKALDRLSLVEWKHGMGILSLPDTKQGLISAIKTKSRAAYSIRKGSSGSDWADFSAWLWSAVTGAPEITLAPLATCSLVWGDALVELQWSDTARWLEFISTPSAMEGTSAWSSGGVTRSEWDAVWQHAFQSKSVASRSSSDGTGLPLPLLFKAFASWMRKQS